jgi:two-component system chemotaxis response regulator CheB
VSPSAPEERASRLSSITVEPHVDDEQEGRRKAQRDIVAIGASAGGVEALGRLIEGLPPELPAAVFVVLHVLPTGTSLLPAILDRGGLLPAAAAIDGEPVERGRVYVAPADHHLLVRADRVVLSRGPRENGHRPAADPLFRSAARAYGPRVVGIVLSGSLDDGTAGLRLVKDRGGVTIAQHPSDALYPGMPASAIEHDAADFVVPMAEMPDLVCELVDAQIELESVIPGDVRQQADLSEDDPRGGTLSPITCPECGGSLWEHDEGGVLRFKCQVGHAYTRESLDTAHGQALEVALWTALRSLEERADLLRRLARRSRGPARMTAGLEAKAEAVLRHAEVVRGVIATLGRDPTAEPPPEVLARVAE